MCESSYLMLIYFKIKKQKKQSNNGAFKTIQNDIVSSPISNSPPRIRNISSEETVVIFNTNKSVKTLTYNNSFTRVTSFTCAD